MTTMTQPWVALRSTAESNGVIVRPMQPNDADLLFAMHQRLSPESIYYRYLQYRRPTLAEIATICRLSPARGAGFVATQQAPASADSAISDPPAIVGMAYYIREAHALEPTAEPGILVEDRCQNQGIGRRLWQQMQRHAQMTGLHRLRVWSHPHNQRLARLVQGGGLPYQTKAYDGLREYLIELGEPLRYGIDGQPGQPISMSLINQYRHGNKQLVWN